MDSVFDTPEQSKVWQTIKALNETWTRGDPADLINYFHKNIIAITPTAKERIQGRDACIAGWTAFTKAAKIHYFNESDPLVQIYGGTAVVTYYYDMSVDMGGMTRQLSGRDMFVLIKQDGTWWVIANQFSGYPEP